MTTYALVAKYRGDQAVYIRELNDDGSLTDSKRMYDGLTYAVARKVIAEQGWTVVKSWREAEQRAEVDAQAETMTADTPLVWKNKVNGWHRAKTDDGVYNIRRWLLNDGEWAPSPADGSAAGASEDRKWVITFETIDDEIENVLWWKSSDELAHSLEHAKTSCQHHANARMLATV